MELQNFKKFAVDAGFQIIEDFREVNGTQIARIKSPKNEEYSVEAFDVSGQTQFRFQPLAGTKNMKSFMLQQAELALFMQMLGQNAEKMMDMKQKGISLMGAFSQAPLPMPVQGITATLKAGLTTKKPDFIPAQQGGNIKKFIKKAYQKINMQQQVNLQRAKTEQQTQQQIEQQFQQQTQQQNQMQQQQQQQQQEPRTQARKPEKKDSKLMKYLSYGAFGGSTAGLIGGSALYTSLFGS